MQNLTEPKKNCSQCNRLFKFRKNNKINYPKWFNEPVPNFGNVTSEIMIVGLAPGLKGANKTGRPFTGDFAGDLLYETLEKFGLSNGKYKANKNDGLKLRNCTITNSVRCVPPKNKPSAEEINNCKSYLLNTIINHKNLKVIIALGHIAHRSIISIHNLKQNKFPFSHSKEHYLENYTLIDSYHCSRYNTNTGRLTNKMFDDIFIKAKKLI